MTTTASEIESKAREAKAASRRLATLSTDVKDAALNALANALAAETPRILEANAADVERGRADGLGEGIIDRLTLTEARLASMAKDVRTVALLPDPVGETFEMRRLPNGMMVGRMRVPFGVIGAIYENRPNVTVDIASLCLKAGSATILRGGKEALQSNIVLGQVIAGALAAAGVPEGAVQVIESSDRAIVSEMLAMKQYIDLVVPRGGEELIRFVEKNASMPVLIGGIGVCHAYIDRDADLRKARDIVVNAKTRRYSICNALDTVVVHADVAPRFLPEVAAALAEKGVELRCDDRSYAILEGRERVVRATPEDYGKEFLALVASVVVVDSYEEAADFIYRYSSGHSDAIVTENYSTALRFLREVDTAVCYVNASTQFTDGAQFGLGAEIIDATQKAHARGPVGLREICTYKWIVFGDGQVRPA
ncbi:MAG TPA: glutamate-5-semialdehyde dehydrogenase [Dehalococcoidia bacterium]|nr:glutamate-5-semialdehyde dehydrogenase [Dehalococcoidia bacterium]